MKKELFSSHRLTTSSVRSPRDDSDSSFKIKRGNMDGQDHGATELLLNPPMQVLWQLWYHKGCTIDEIRQRCYYDLELGFTVEIATAVDALPEPPQYRFLVVFSNPEHAHWLVFVPTNEVLNKAVWSLNEAAKFAANLPK